MMGKLQKNPNSVVNAKTQIVYDFIALVSKNWAIADPNVNVGTV